MSQQNHPLSHMIATNYAGGFNHAAQAAQNFSNQAHNYNTSAYQTPINHQQQIMTPTNMGGGYT